MNQFINIIKIILFIFLVIFQAKNLKADTSKIAKEIMSQINFEAVIAVQPIDSKNSKISKSSSSSLLDKLTNSIQIASQSKKNITLVERSKLDAVMMEQEEFQNISEFSDLVSNLGADILISPSVNRINNKEVEISARAIGLSGDNAGKVLSASNTYKINLPAKYIFVVNSIISRGKDRMAYASAINSGISSFTEAIVKDSASSGVSEADFIIDIEFALIVTEKETKESKAAKKQAESNKMAANLFGNIMGGTGGNNPFGAILGDSKKNEAKAKSLRKKVFTVEAIGKMKNNILESEITENITLDESLGVDASTDEQKMVAKRTVNSALEQLGKKLVAKALGISSEKESTSSLLD